MTMDVHRECERAPEGWRMWHGSDGTGHAAETNLELAAELAAGREVEPGGRQGRRLLRQQFGPVVSEGRVYYACKSKGLYCCDAITGQTLWSKSHDGGNPVPCVDEDRVYAATRTGVSSRRGQLRCFDKRTGKLLWETGDIGPGSDADGSGEWASPMVHGDLVFYGRSALNKFTGETVWSGSTSVEHKPVDYNGRTLMLNSAGSSLKDPLTGATVISAGGTSANGEGWYRSTVLYGTNTVWTIKTVKEFGGKTLRDLATPASSPTPSRSRSATPATS